ncbi:hypothetical protein ACFW3Z_11585 [Nocardiopsis alba]|uniref:hypothetical protein n=1 Tax=Nocardiopsis alba TaxID=53437 RepID=UPI0033BA17BA
MSPHAHEPPAPFGVEVDRLGPEEVDGVLDDVFVHGRRCRLLDEVGAVPGPQWLLAELGDGRITGSCPGDRWRRSDGPGTAHLSAPSLDPRVDRWRILEVLVFSAHAQIRLGEAADTGWVAVDSAEEGPEWLRPRDRSFLLQGWTGDDHGRTLEGETPMAITREPSGNEAVLPAPWTAPSGRLRHRPGSDRAALESRGTWLTVREYWAADPATGAVGVAFHRLTGVHNGTKPTGPEFDVGTGDQIEEG